MNIEELLEDQVALIMDWGNPGSQEFARGYVRGAVHMAQLPDEAGQEIQDRWNIRIDAWHQSTEA